MIGRTFRGALHYCRATTPFTEQTSQQISEIYMPESRLPMLKTTSNSMSKVDRLGWAFGFSLKSYGVRIGIRSNDPSALASARQHLPSDWEAVSSPFVDPVYSIFVCGKRSRANVRRLNLLH